MQKQQNMTIATMTILALIQCVQLCTSLITSRTFLKGVSHATGKNKMAFNTSMYFGTYDVACNSRQHSRQNLNVKIIIFMIIQVNSIHARNNVSLRDSSILWFVMKLSYMLGSMVIINKTSSYEVKIMNPDMRQELCKEIGWAVICFYSFK